MVAVDKIESFELFLELRENWEELYRQDHEADIFLSWRWLSQVYENRDEGVFILAVKRSSSASRYCAFFPLRREIRFSASRTRFFDSFSMAGNYWADSTGILCDPELDSVAIPALAHAVKALSWQRILFESLKISSCRKVLLLAPFACQDYYIGEKTHTDNHGDTDLSRSPFVALPDTFEQYLERKTRANTRQKIRRIRRAIEDDSSLSIQVADESTIEKYLHFFERAWIKNWKSVKGKSAITLAAKYSALIRLGLRSGDMLVPVLVHDSRPVGLLACYKDQVKGQLSFFVAGRDADFKAIPGGLALHAHCIEWAINNHYTRYNLLRGNEPYKYSLGATDFLLNNIVLYKKDPSPSLHLLNHHLVKPALALLTRQVMNLSTSDIHNLYGQLLESFPNDRQVLSHYSDWLSSVALHEHADDIARFLKLEKPVRAGNVADARIATSIDVRPFLDFHQWLDQLAEKQESLMSGCSIRVRDLHVDVASSEREYITWIKTYLYPLVDESGFGERSCDQQDPEKPDESRYNLRFVHSDELVTKIMRLVSTVATDVKTVTPGGQRINRLHLTSDLAIDIKRQEGVVWISDNEQRQLTLLMSSRTRWPSLEVSRTARTLITAYLQQEGWVFLHSGAIRINDKNYLVIGDEGQGKTSLILSLMSAGSRYISNERVFVRKTEGEVEALSFPMPVAIGMGTALQYPEIMRHVYNPEHSLYPQRRMDPSKLRSTPESGWSSLNDKVQLLVPELTAAFNHDRALQGGCVSGVIVPAIVKNADENYRDKTTALKKEELREIVKRNHIWTERDARYPAWLPLAFDAAPVASVVDVIASVYSLPGIRIEYSATREREEKSREYPGMLAEALS